MQHFDLGSLQQQHSCLPHKENVRMKHDNVNKNCKYEMKRLDIPINPDFLHTGPQTFCTVLVRRTWIYIKISERDWYFVDAAYC